MAEDKSKPAEPAAASDPGASHISPAPTEVTEKKPDGAPQPEHKDPVVPADPLSDGTVPTILSSGSVHHAETKGRASITSIYRKADILTTAFTFAGAIVAAGIIFGVYYFFTKPKAGTTVKPPTVTSLDKADLSKLGAFFEGNTAGGSGQVLTINSSSLFKNRVAVSSDLKVTGGVDVTGATTLADLFVNKTATLGVTNIRGQLVVAGPVNFQSPAQFGAGGTVNGNLSVTGNGTFGGSISAGTLNAANISVTNVNLSGHLSITGSSPSASGIGLGTSATVEGNDSSGTVTVTVGPCSSAQCLSAGGQLVTVTFHNSYPRTPHITISPIGAAAARILPYVQPGASSFTIGAASISNNSTTTFSFTYWVVQ